MSLMSFVLTRVVHVFFLFSLIVVAHRIKHPGSKHTFVRVWPDFLLNVRTRTARLYSYVLHIFRKVSVLCYLVGLVPIISFPAGSCSRTPWMISWWL